MKRNRTRHEFEKVTGRATTRLQCEAGDRSHDLGHPGFLVGRVAANWFVGTMPSSSTSEFLLVQVVSWQVQQPADQQGVVENVHRTEPRMRVRHPPRQKSSGPVIEPVCHRVTGKQPRGTESLPASEQRLGWCPLQRVYHARLVGTGTPMKEATQVDEKVASR